MDDAGATSRPPFARPMSMHRRRAGRRGLAPLWVLLPALLLATPAPAEQSAGAGPATLAEAVAAALERAGQLIRVQGLTGEASAVRRQASAWTAEDPALRLKGISDRFTEHAGAYEVEAMLELPLWLPGQRRARLELAHALGLRADALAGLLHWEIAGAVREAVWRATLAHVRLRQAAAAHQAAQTLEQVVAKRAAAGELARLDLLTARQESLARAAERTAAQADYDQAIAAYVQQTGLSRLPEPPNQPASQPTLQAAGESAALPSAHPLLAEADAALARARAERARVRADRPGHPVLSVGAIRSRDDRSVPASDALQLEINIPFGLPSQSAPALAVAERDLTERLAELHRLRREAQLELRAAVLGRRGAAQALAVAEERAAAAAEALRVARRAFELGETDLESRLRAERRAREAELDLALRRAEQGQALARLNQALGIVPK